MIPVLLLSMVLPGAEQVSLGQLFQPLAHPCPTCWAGRGRKRSPRSASTVQQEQNIYWCVINIVLVRDLKLNTIQAAVKKLTPSQPVHVYPFSKMEKKKKSETQNNWNKTQHVLLNYEDSFITGIICKEAVDSPPLCPWLRIGWVSLSLLRRWCGSHPLLGLSVKSVNGIPCRNCSRLSQWSFCDLKNHRNSPNVPFSPSKWNALLHLEMGCSAWMRSLV